jgi:glycosyltransferase involved in cell wall biosynthesis
MLTSAIAVGPTNRSNGSGRAASRATISVIFPAFNEEMNLEAVVRSALKVLPSVSRSFEIIIVNDGSHDGTGEVAERLTSRSRHVRVVHHPRNLGYGAALKSGIEQARHEFIFFCDSDRQFSLKDLHRLLAWAGRFDIVAGYRQSRQDPIHRRLNAKGWNLLVRLVFGLNLRDIDCAFKIFRREVFESLPIETVGAMVNTEILVRALSHGFTIKEVPVRHFPRRFGEQTGAKPHVILKAMCELARMYVKMRFAALPSLPPVAIQRAAE